MYGLAVNLIVKVSGHPWIINEMRDFLNNDDILPLWLFSFSNSFRIVLE